MAHRLGSCEVSFGVAGWSYPDWQEIVYPRGSVDQLRYIAEFVDLVEINASFYRFIPPATAEGWLARTADLPGFRFTAKTNRVFTHEEPDAFGPAEVRAFAAGLAPLRRAGRLSALLFQFPFSFRDGHAARERLSELARAFAGFPLVLEVRHGSWEAPEALEFVAEAGYSVANLDLPLAPDSFGAQTVATGEPGYLRLHGRNAENWFSSAPERHSKYDYLYDDSELEELAARIEALSRRFRELIVVTNNHFRGKALANLAELSVRAGGEPRPLPAGLVRTYPRLAAVSRPAAVDSAAEDARRRADSRTRGGPQRELFES